MTPIFNVVVGVGIVVFLVGATMLVVSAVRRSSKPAPKGLETTPSDLISAVFKALADFVTAVAEKLLPALGKYLGKDPMARVGGLLMFMGAFLIVLPLILGVLPSLLPTSDKPTVGTPTP